MHARQKCERIKDACTRADGVVVGSALVKVIEENLGDNNLIEQLVIKKLKDLF